MKKPFWVWAGADNSNAPTGNPATAVVIEPTGEVRAAGAEEDSGEAEVFLVTEASDVALLPVRLPEPAKIFRIEGDAVLGWACDLPTLTSAISPDTQRERRYVVALARLQGQIRRVSSQPVTADTGSFLSRIRQEAATVFLAGTADPVAGEADLRTQLATLTAEIKSRMGDAALERISAEAENYVDNGGWDDFGDEDDRGSEEDDEY